MDSLRIAVAQEVNPTAHEPDPSTPRRDHEGHGTQPSGADRTGFFISPLRPPQTREDVERAWKDAE